MSIYRPEIDGLRAIAVCAVILNHLNPYFLTSGFLGVDIFFVISGYVITSSLSNYKEKSLFNFLIKFYSNRVKRLIPALFFTVVVSGILLGLVSPNNEQSLKTGIYSLYGLSNIYLYQISSDYFSPKIIYNAFMHTWSLGAEEQFYLIFPFIFYVALIFKYEYFRKYFLITFIGILSIISFLSFEFTRINNFNAAFYLMPNRFWELGIGIFGYFINSNFHNFLDAIRKKYSKYVMGLLSLIAVIFIIPQVYFPITTPAIAILTMLVITLINGDSKAFLLLTKRPILHVGKISYSAYLWHYPLLTILHWLIFDSFLFLIIYTISLILFSEFSYIFIEQKFKNLLILKNKWASILFGVFLVLIGSSVLFLENGPLKSSFKKISSAFNPGGFQPQAMVVSELSCHIPKFTNSPIEECLTPKDAHKQTLYILGDSHATNHVPSISKATQGMNVEVRYLVEWGFIGSLVGVPNCIDNPSKPCIDNGFDKQMDFLSSHLKKGDLVIFSWTRDQIRAESPFPRKLLSGQLLILKQKLVIMKSVVTSAGGSLLLVDDIPKPCTNDVRWDVIYATGNHLLCSTSADVSKEDRRPLTELYKSLADNHKTFYFDPHDLLCKDGICGIYDQRSKSLMYSENSPHFTVSRPSPLADDWRNLLLNLLPKIQESPKGS